MTHEVLRDTAVLVAEVAGLNGYTESFRGFPADVRPSLALVLATLPLISHPVAFRFHGKGSGAASSTKEVFRLGRDDNRGLLGIRSLLSL